MWAANPGCRRLSAGALRLALRRFPAQETLAKGSSITRVNASDPRARVPSNRKAFPASPPVFRTPRPSTFSAPSRRLVSHFLLARLASFRQIPAPPQPGSAPGVVKSFTPKSTLFFPRLQSLTANPPQNARFRLLVLSGVGPRPAHPSRSERSAFVSKSVIEPRPSPASHEKTAAFP